MLYSIFPALSFLSPGHNVVTLPTFESREPTFMAGHGLGIGLQTARSEKENIFCSTHHFRLYF